MALDNNTVAKIAKLARIELSEEEISTFSKELTNIFDWIELLQEVNTDDIPEMAGVGDYTLRMRDDTVNDGGNKDEVLSNAPEQAFDCYVVPKVVE